MKRILAVTQTKGWRHDNIPVALETLRALGQETLHWEIARRVEADDEVAEAITEDGLSGIDAVAFANTSGDLSFTDEGRAAFFRWVRRGGAVIGLHSATDTFHGDPEYLRLIGAEFDTHGPEREVRIHVQDPTHPACRGLPASFALFEEIYEFRHLDRRHIHPLLCLHEHPQTGLFGDYPLAWTNQLGQGRIFYTALGHREEVYANPLFRKHLTGGVAWVLGLAAAEEPAGS
jgi:uncharacterized protein